MLIKSLIYTNNLLNINLDLYETRLSTWALVKDNNFNWYQKIFTFHLYFFQNQIQILKLHWQDFMLEQLYEIQAHSTYWEMSNTYAM